MNDRKLRDLSEWEQIKAMLWLWDVMGAIYGHRWAANYDPDVSKGAGRLWAEGLGDLTGKQIAEGVRACRTGTATKDGWPPTIGEFRAIALGVPTLSTLKAQIAGRQPPSRFSVAVWASMDRFRYRGASAEVGDRMLESAYNEVREAVLGGQELPDMPVAALEKPQEPVLAPGNPEVAAKAMREIAEALGRQFKGSVQ